MEQPITKKKINNHKVEPIPIKKVNVKIKGAELCSQLYCNIYMVAPTNSGKTTAIFKLLKDMASRKKTEIIVFASTLYNDDNWLFMQKYFSKKGYNFTGYTAIKDNGVDELVELIKDLKEQAIERAKENEEPENKNEEAMNALRKAYNMIVEPKEKKKKDKKDAPDYILVFDDVSDEIRSKVIDALLKRSRHFHIKTITSTQYPKDISPASRKQIWLWMLFSGMTEEQLENIYKLINLRMPYELFTKLYYDATTSTPESLKPFFYLSPREHDYRKNFNERYVIPKNLL